MQRLLRWFGLQICRGIKSRLLAKSVSGKLFLHRDLRFWWNASVKSAILITMPTLRSWPRFTSKPIPRRTILKPGRFSPLHCRYSPSLLLYSIWRLQDTDVKRLARTCYYCFCLELQHQRSKQVRAPQFRDFQTESDCGSSYSFQGSQWSRSEFVLRDLKSD